MFELEFELLVNLLVLSAVLCRVCLTCFYCNHFLLFLLLVVLLVLQLLLFVFTLAFIPLTNARQSD